MRVNRVERINQTRKTNNDRRPTPEEIKKMLQMPRNPDDTPPAS